MPTDTQRAALRKAVAATFALYDALAELGSGVVVSGRVELDDWEESLAAAGVTREPSDEQLDALEGELDDLEPLDGPFPWEDPEGSMTDAELYGDDGDGEEEEEDEAA